MNAKCGPIGGPKQCQFNKHRQMSSNLGAFYSPIYVFQNFRIQQQGENSFYQNENLGNGCNTYIRSTRSNKK